MGVIGSSAPNPFALALAKAIQMADPARPINALGHVAATVARDEIPAHLRIFASTIMGDRSPITEGNFSPPELQAMRDLVSSNQKAPFYRKGAVTYGDYATAPTAFQDAAGTTDGRAHVGPLYGGFGFGNPALTAVGNTVGQFNYKTAPDGSTHIDDNYSWGSGRPDGGPQKGNSGLLAALSNLLSTGSLEQLGAAAVPDRAHGRPVSIDLPALPPQSASPSPGGLLGTLPPSLDGLLSTLGLNK